MARPERREQLQRPVVPPQPPAEWRGEQRVAPPQRPAQVQRLLPSQPVADWQGEQRPAPPSDVVPPRLRAQARKSYTQVIAQTQADRDWLSAALTAQTPVAPLPKRESSARPAWAMPEHAALPGSHQPVGSKLGDISNVLAGNRFQFLRSAALGAIAPVVVLTLAAIIGIGSWQRADLFSIQGQSTTTNVPKDLLSEGETSSETQQSPTALATSTASVPTLEPSSVAEEAALATTSVIATDVAITPVISVPTPTIASQEPTPTFPSTGEGILIVPTITGGGAATPIVMTLYFPDPTSATIVPAQYEIREPDGVTIANVLKGLLAGPPANLAPTLAPGTQVLSVAFDGGTLSIDLDRPIPGILERRALELTLAQFPGITSVRLLVNGSVI